MRARCEPSGLTRARCLPALRRTFTGKCAVGSRAWVSRFARRALALRRTQTAAITPSSAANLPWAGFMKNAARPRILNGSGRSPAFLARRRTCAWMATRRRSNWRRRSSLRAGASGWPGRSWPRSRARDLPSREARREQVLRHGPTLALRAQGDAGCPMRPVAIGRAFPVVPRVSLPGYPRGGLADLRRIRFYAAGTIQFQCGIPDVATDVAVSLLFLCPDRPIRVPCRPGVARFRATGGHVDRR